MKGAIAASSSVMSLINGEGITKEIPSTHRCFDLFRDCKGLTQATELPTTQLASGCNYGMFVKCEGLTQMPQITIQRSMASSTNILTSTIYINQGTNNISIYCIS